MKGILLTARGLLDRQRDWSPILLRVPVGMLFLLAGWMKIRMIGWLSFKPDIPLGHLVGPLVPAIEFFGGICLIAGLATRAWALLLACIMLFAIAFVHGPEGFLPGEPGKGWANHAVLLAALLVLVIQGAGTLSVDRLLFARKGGSGSPGA
jgi:putative oxidoreductase